MLMTINGAAEKYEIASLRIDMLVINKAITRCVQTSPYSGKREIMVDTTELDRYFHDNPSTLEIWQRDRSIVQNGILL